MAGTPCAYSHVLYLTSHKVTARQRGRVALYYRGMGRRVQHATYAF